MHKWMSLPLLFVAACTNPAEPNAFTVGNATATLDTTGDATMSGSGTEDSSGTGSSSSGVDESTTSEGTSSSSSSSGGVDSSSGAPDPVCGNGMTEDGEQCDDGDDDEFDECTSECAVPVCDDGAHNGDETDMDCGGSCQGCDLCLLCDTSDDCAGEMECNDLGLCSVHAEMSVDWSDNCGGITDGAVVQDLPAGTYLATAVMSAGTLWLPPHTPPSTGYFYEIECNAGVELDELATPAGVRYASIATAFANLGSNVQEFDFIGGDLTCYRSDATCGDNDGGVEFTLDYICPESR
jgi:hypothetical protein